MLKIYSPDCELVKTIRRDEGIVLGATHIQEMNQYVISSSDLQLSFYDELSYREVKSMHTPSSQMCLTWSAGTKSLYTAGVSGVIYAWDAERMEERHHMGGPGKDGRLCRDSHEDMVLDLLEIRSLESLASGSMDKTIRLWDMNTGKAR